MHNKEHTKKENANARMSYLVLPATQVEPSQSQKSHFFAHDNKLIMKVDNKMLKINVKYITLFNETNTTIVKLNYFTVGVMP